MFPPVFKSRAWSGGANAPPAGTDGTRRTSVSRRDPASPSSSLPTESASSSPMLGIGLFLMLKQRMFLMANSLAHTKWNCKYHIVFAPKYRRKVAYGKMKQDIANILSMLCKRKGVEIVEAEICPDHVHMLVKIPPSLSVSSFVGYLKGKSTLMIFERHANLKYKYGNRTFWCRGYYVDTAGKNAQKIAEYIRLQLEEDQAGEQ